MDFMRDENDAKILKGKTGKVFAVLHKQLEILKEHGHKDINYSFDSVDLWILHGVICLGAQHPGFQALSGQSKKAVERFRCFCKNVWMEQGMSADEAELLNTLRVEINKAYYR